MFKEVYMAEQKLSVVIPAYNEENNLVKTVTDLQEVLRNEKIPYELILVNDNSTDNTSKTIKDLMDKDENVRTVNRRPPRGFGRAVRSGLEVITGDAVIICMADSSDDPKDVAKYYKKLEEGYDCVFGSRFIKNSKIEKYPVIKLIVNRIVNKSIQWMFWCKFNDLTNVFKAYKVDVIRSCGPYRGCHFNITLELSLNALVRKYSIAQIPINWYGRTRGSSNFSLKQMGRRYLATLIKIYAEKILISDDLEAEKLAHSRQYAINTNEILSRIEKLEKEMLKLKNMKN